MDFSLTTRNEGDVVIIETNGYLNNVGGEQIAQTCYKEIDGGKKLFLINLENSKVVNSIGVSILIEIIEKLQVWPKEKQQRQEKMGCYLWKQTFQG